MQENQKLKVKTTRFQYPPYIRLFTLVMNMGAFLMPIYIIGRVVYKFYVAEIRITWEIISIVPLLAGVAFLAFGVILLAANFFPEIKVSGFGLEVQFMWRYLPVPWAEIVELETKKSVFGRTYLRMVKTNALVPFHKFYGLFYGKKAVPSFCIHPIIENYDELIQRIESEKGS